MVRRGRSHHRQNLSLAAVAVIPATASLVAMGIVAWHTAIVWILLSGALVFARITHHHVHRDSRRH
jgi:thiosulfate reductase cytochrome b subunit